MQAPMRRKSPCGCRQERRGGTGIGEDEEVAVRPLRHGGGRVSTDEEGCGG
jgi:hypothetical protein